MQGDRQLDDAETAAEVAAGRGDRRDDRLADLGRELVELSGGEIAKISRAAERRQDRRWDLGLARHGGDGLQLRIERWRSAHRRASDGFAPSGATAHGRMVNVF